VSAPRRQVRATPDFFVQLDVQLGSERGPNGEPSSVDFEAYDLLDIIEEFATGWDDLAPLIIGGTQYRILIARGRLVAAYSVVGQLAPDGAIELVKLDIDLMGLA
jgi:hypothetical protein